MVTYGIDVRWAESDVRISEEGRKLGYRNPDTRDVVYSNPDETNPLTLDSTDGRSRWPWLRVELDEQWLASLNPAMRNNNSRVFTSIATAAGLFESPVDNVFAERILSAPLVNGMSITGFWARVQNEYNVVEDWQMHMMRRERIYQSNRGDDKSWPEYKMSAEVRGYAFDWSRRTMRFSCVILLFYSAIAIAHFGWYVVKGVSSSSWDTASEISTLVFNSRPTPALEYTCAGIAGLETFKKPEKIVRRRVGNPRPS